MSARCLSFYLLFKWLGQLSGDQPWFNTIEDDIAFTTAAAWLHRQDNAHRGPNLGQVVSAPWAVAARATPWNGDGRC